MAARYGIPGAYPVGGDASDLVSSLFGKPQLSERCQGAGPIRQLSEPKPRELCAVWALAVNSSQGQVECCERLKLL